MKKVLCALLAAVMMLTMFVSCSNKKDQGKILTVQLGPNPETIDPALNSAVDGANMILFAYDCLMNIDKDGKVIPGAAEKMDVSADGLTYTFTLRDGLKWSDGTALTAADFVYSWKRVADPKTAAPYAETVLGMVKGYADATKEGGNIDALEVKATDDKTFVVTLDHVCPYFDKLAAFATLSPVQKATIEKNGDAWATKAETYVTNGAFYIKEWVPSSYILFAKNENYREAADIKLDGIKCLLIEDPNAAYAAYQSGEALMIKDVPTAEIKAMKEAKNPEFHLDPILGTYYVSVNDSLEKFPVDVRMAMNLAIDRTYVADTLMDGVYTPATNFVSPGLSDPAGGDFYAKANGGKGYLPATADIEAAKKLMNSSGYNESNHLKAVYSTNDAGYHKIVAQYLQEAWKEIYIDLEVKVVEWASFTPMRREGNYELSRNGWVCDYNDVSNLLELMISTNGNNDGKYNSAVFDDLMKKAAAESDPAKRSAYMHQAEDTMMADASCLPIAYYNDFYLQSAKITGSWHSPYGFWYFQYADIAD